MWENNLINCGGLGAVQGKFELKNGQRKEGTKLAWEQEEQDSHGSKRYYKGECSSLPSG